MAALAATMAASAAIAASAAMALSPVAFLGCARADRKKQNTQRSASGRARREVRWRRPQAQQRLPMQTFDTAPR